MNKRFSTLLASALLVGSGFSASAFNGTFDAKKYYQIRLYTDVSGTAIDNSALTIIPSADGLKDSLVYKHANYYSSIDEVNAMLWKPSFEKKTSDLGEVYYETKLVNKNGTELIISTTGVDADKSFYKSKPAYLGATGMAGVITDKNGPYTIGEDGKITFTANIPAVRKVYDATAKKTFSYALAVTKNAGISYGQGTGTIKIMKVTGDNIAAGADYDLLWMGLEEVGSYFMSPYFLNPETFDSFQLTFSNDVKSSEIGNLFSENKLRAVYFDEMYSPAVYAKTYAENAKAAKAALKKAFDDIKPAYAALKAEYATAIDRAKAKNATATGKLVDLAENKIDLDAAVTNNATTGLKYLRSLSSTDNPALWNVIDAIRTEFDKIELTAEAKLGAEDAKLKAYLEAVKAADKKLKAVEDDAALAFSVTDSVMKVYQSQPYRPATVAAAFKAGRETTQLEKFKATGVETLQRNFLNSSLTGVPAGAVTDTGDKLIAVYTAATDVNAISSVSYDILNNVNNSQAYYAGGHYALAIVDSLIDGKQAYLCVDTNYVAKNEQYFGFKADTLTTVADANKKITVAGFGKSINMFAYLMTVDPSNIGTVDNITINTFKPAAAKNYLTITPEKAVVVIRTLANNHREVSVAGSVSDPAYKNSTISFKTITLPLAELEEGDIYYIKNLKKAFAKKPYMVLTSTTYDAIVASANAYANVPATQWFVSSANKTSGIYTIANREVAAQKFFNNAKLFKYAENTYITAAGDTVELAKLDTEDAHLGYKFITEDAAKLQTYTLTAKTFANPEAVWYLTMGADSAVVATQDKAKALTMKVIDRNNYELGDDRLNQDDYFMQAYLGEDTLYFTTKFNYLRATDVTDFDMTLYLSKDSSNIWEQGEDGNEFFGMTLRRVNDNDGQYELLAGAEGSNLVSYKIGINQDGKAVIVNPIENTNWVFDLAFAQTEDYLNDVDAPKNVTISLLKDAASKITKAGPFAAIKRAGLELVDGKATTENDFVLTMDTAYVSRPNNFRYAYYISKPFDVNAAGTFDKKLYMVNYQDSVAVQKKDTLYTQDNLTKVGFVLANRVHQVKNDTLAIAMGAPVKADSIDVAAKKGITNATWAFAIDKDKDGVETGFYRIETAPNKYVSYLNGILVIGDKKQAQLFEINKTDLTPTKNETVATSAIKVVAGEGNVTIAGAQGKKVVITNVLGQVIANTVITSDDATIAASAGVVVVAVEGEAAVKAIVK